MDVYVARQPILDVQHRVVAYELLYREGPENRFPGIDATQAASRVIEQAVAVFGLDSLAPHSLAYINMTRPVLVGGLYRMLPPDRVVLELLESIVPDKEVLHACDEARHHGYTLALDDYAFQPELAPLAEKVNVLKVEWPAMTGRTDLAALAAPALKHGQVLLAEKVETREDVARARAAGFGLFQGFYFFRPEMIQAREVPASKLHSLQLVRAVSQARFDMAEVEKLLRQDVGLSLRFLKYLNSAAFALRSEVTSLRQALVFLGERGMRTWVSVMALTNLGSDRPAALMTSCLVRARACELIARASQPPPPVDAFLLGMLSLLDALLGRPEAEVLKQSGVDPVLEAAILRGAGPGGALLGAVMDLEMADFAALAERARVLHCPEEKIAQAFTEATAWAEQVMASW